MTNKEMILTNLEKINPKYTTIDAISAFHFAYQDRVSFLMHGADEEERSKPVPSLEEYLNEEC